MKELNACKQLLLFYSGGVGQSLRVIACRWMREEKFGLFGKIFKNGCKMPTNVL
jgi:hypothetical protein